MEIKISYRHKENPFIITKPEDWNNVMDGWWVQYYCDKCGEDHVKTIRCNHGKLNAFPTCLNKITYCDKEKPFIITKPEDWKMVKVHGWWVKYHCDKCGEDHVKNISRNRGKLNAFPTCLNKITYCDKENPFIITKPEDWKKVKVNGWWVKYHCDKCGEDHVKMIHHDRGKFNASPTCLNKISYRHKEKPFIITKPEDWKMVKVNGWWVKYHCDVCNEDHVKKIRCNKNGKFNASPTCLNKISYRHKEKPFIITKPEDWKMVKVNGWWVKYHCDVCNEDHVKKIRCNKNGKLNASPTCLNKRLYYNKNTPYIITKAEDWEKVNCGWWVKYHCDVCNNDHVKVITRHNGKKYNFPSCLSKSTETNNKMLFVDGFMFVD